jgi:hypothetical protein
MQNLKDDVVAGKTSMADATRIMEEWVDFPWKERQINDAWHTLTYFEIDQDIRDRQPEYDSRVKQQLRSLAENLRKPTD